MKKARKKNEIPKFILDQEGLSARAWRAQKRSELKRMINAFDQYRFGCAYCPPCDGAVVAIQNALARLKEGLSFKVWR